MGESKIIVPAIAKPAWTRVAGESLERLGVAPRALQNYLSYVAIVFLAYLIAGKLGQATTNIRSSNLGPVWPAYGVAVAAILLCGYRVWIGIAGAAFVVALLSPVPLMAAVGQAAGATVAALTGVFLLYRIARFDPSLSRLRDALALIVFGAMGSAIVSATVGVSVLYATHLHAYSGLGSAWLIYWLGDSTGVLLVTPLVLTFPRLLKISPRVRVAEFAVLLVVLTAICFTIFGNLLSSTEGDIFVFVVLPFVMWGAIRFGLSGAALATLVIATIATLGTALGHGPFAQSSPFVNAVLLDLYFAVLSASGMTLAAVIAEREQAERQREQLAREQAAMETRLQLSAIVRSSDERFHLAAQAGRMYAYEWDAATDMVTRSEGCLNILGLSSSEAQLTRQQFSAKVHPDDRALFVSADRDVTPENRTSKISYRVIRSDGSVVWVERNACAFFDEQGRLQRMVGMVADITERQRAEETLLEVNRTLEAQAALLQSSEDLLKIFVKNVPVGVAMFDRDMRYLEVSDRWCADYSVDSSQVLGRSHYELFPDIPPRWKEMHRRGLDGETLRADEDRWDREGGTAWLRWEIRPWRTPNGIVGGILIFAEQITHRKQMEEAISSMSKKLIESQEQERARIGRELHDDINQRLGLLAVQLEQLRADPSEVQSHVQELLKQATEISDDVQALSHQLHASKLEYLGALGGMRSWCKEFGERQGMQIDFQSSEANISVPREIGLCLFRVLQEALHNAAKYSGVRRIEVQLREDCGDIHLLVTDLGRGFDLETARQGRGLGLTSMQERVRLVNGILEIRSTPMGGTTVHVCVPLTSEPRSQAAAG